MIRKRAAGQYQVRIDLARDEGILPGGRIRNTEHNALVEVRAALEKAKRVVVLEKTLAVGLGGVVSDAAAGILGS